MAKKGYGKPRLIEEEEFTKFDSGSRFFYFNVGEHTACLYLPPLETLLEQMSTTERLDDDLYVFDTGDSPVASSQEITLSEESSGLATEGHIDKTLVVQYQMSKQTPKVPPPLPKRPPPPIPGQTRLRAEESQSAHQPCLESPKVSPALEDAKKQGVDSDLKVTRTKASKKRCNLS